MSQTQSLDRTQICKQAVFRSLFLFALIIFIKSDDNDATDDLDVVIDEPEGEEDQNFDALDELRDVLELASDNFRVLPVDDQEVPQSTDNIRDDSTVRKIMASHFPRPIRTREEVTRYLQLYEECANGQQKLMLIRMAERWNTMLINELVAMDEANRKDHGKLFSPKTPNQLRAFKDRFEKALEARAILDAHSDRFKELRRMLKTHTIQPMAAETIIPVTPHTHEEEQDREEVENTPPEDVENAPAEPRNTTPIAAAVVVNNPIENMEQFAEWVLTPNLDLCAVCLQPRKLPDVAGYTQGHGKSTCNGIAPTHDEKLLLRKYQKRIRRGNQK